MTAPDPTTGEAPRRRIGALDAGVALALGLLAAWLYGHTRPGVVNLDGLGYVKLLPHNFSAGHLLYMPLLRLATAVLHGDGLRAAFAVSIASTALAVALSYLLARAWLGRLGSSLVGGAMAVSYAVWIQGADVEAYGCALLALLAVLALALAYERRPTAARAASLGLSLGCAVLFHLTHVIASPFVAVWVIARAPSRRRGLLHAAVALGLGGAVTLASYAWAALHVRHLDLAGALRWIGTAGHGFRYAGSWLGRLADSLYGLAKAFVWAPYLYESNQQHVIGQFILGLAPLVVCVALIAVHRRSLAPLPWRSLGVWMAAYTAMALLFFGSDHERWLFVLPPLLLLTARAVERTARPWAWATGLVAFLAIANAATAIGPAHNDSWARTQADDAAALMKPGDLVIFPGHSWDEYVGFYTGTKVVHFPIAYYAGRDGNAAMRARLDKEIALARQRGSTIWAVRLLDARPDDQQGFQELELLGLDRRALRELVVPRFTAVPLPTVEPKVTVWRLDDPPAVAPRATP